MSWTSWYIPKFPALGIQRQEDCCEFQVSHERDLILS